MKQRLLLLAILALAAALRFTALGWGLRHLPHVDERFFVETVAQMLQAGDLNHRFFEYPALFSYFLGVVLAFLPAPQTGPDAYYAARAVNASFGIASVVLTYLLGHRMAGPRAGLFAAALLAVSPLEVRTAHVVRPDVTLHPFMLLALLAFTRIGPDLKGDVLSGAAIGLATAVKFSAPLIAPAYLARRLLAAGFRWWKPILAAAVSVVVFGVCSPYTLVSEDSAFGMWKQVRYHYNAGRGPLGVGGTAAAYGFILVSALGVIGALLGLGGVVIWRRSWREWVPLALLPIAFVAVFSTAAVRADRFLIPTLGAVCVLAGVAVQAAAAWRPAVGLAVALAAIAQPLHSSAEYLGMILQPTTKDLAADWIEATYPTGARVLLTTATDLGLDKLRFEVMRVNRIRSVNRLCAGEHDLVIADPSNRELMSQTQPVKVIRPKDQEFGRSFLILAPSPAERPEYVPLDLSHAVSSVGGSVEVRFREPVVLGRIEVFPVTPASFAADVEVSVASPEQRLFKKVPAAACRPPFDQQVAPRSQVWVLDGVRAQALRVTGRGRALEAAAIAQLEIKALKAPARQQETPRPPRRSLSARARRPA